MAEERFLLLVHNDDRSRFFPYHSYLATWHNRLALWVMLRGWKQTGPPNSAVKRCGSGSFPKAYHSLDTPLFCLFQPPPWDKTTGRASRLSCVSSNPPIGNPLGLHLLAWGMHQLTVHRGMLKHIGVAARAA